MQMAVMSTIIGLTRLGSLELTCTKALSSPISNSLPTVGLGWIWQMLASANRHECTREGLASYSTLTTSISTEGISSYSSNSYKLASAAMASILTLKSGDCSCSGMLSMEMPSLVAAYVGGAVYLFFISFLFGIINNGQIH